MHTSFPFYIFAIPKLKNNLFEKMKNLKLLSLSAVLAVVVTIFSSCLDDGNSDRLIGPYWVSVESSLGTKILKADYLPDYTFIPTNPSLLADYERACVYFKVTDDVVFKKGGKYNLEIYPYGSFGINVRNILNAPLAGSTGDTLRNDSVRDFALVSAYGDYVTTGAALKGISSYYVDMVKEKVANDTLYLRLNLNLKKGEKSTETYDSFIMPSGEVLRQEGIVPKGDSIVVAVSAKVYNGYKNEVKTNYSKYKLE